MATNLYTQMADLFKQPQLMSGEVTDVGDGTAVVRLPGGGNITARGTASIGAFVYVRNGTVEGEAPDLPEYSIDI